MALVQQDLADGLEATFAGLNSATVAAYGMAADYASYAASGTFGLSVPTIVGESAMGATLLAAISSPAAGSPAAFGNAWASALATFWTAVAVAGGSGSGVTAGCPGAAAAGTAITAAVTTLTHTPESVAAAIAAALHTATQTVTASLTTPPAAPVVYPCT